MRPNNSKRGSRPYAELFVYRHWLRAPKGYRAKAGNRRYSGLYSSPGPLDGSVIGINFSIRFIFQLSHVVG
jgi:hypothetical protein